MGSKQELSQFLAGVERRAFRMTQLAVGNSEDALDLLQEAMMKLVQKYPDRPPEEWGPLFQTILQSRIRDFYRRNAIRNRFRVWFNRSGGEGDGADPLQEVGDEHGRRPDRETESGQALGQLDTAVRALPIRQQQAFMLRALEGLDVATTARVMKCSEGSVKTHYSRAVHTLRRKLKDHHGGD